MPLLEDGIKKIINLNFLLILLVSQFPRGFYFLFVSQILLVITQEVTLYPIIISKISIVFISVLPIEL